jgi:archaellum biogenesis protein FlaJ (TadC family)
MRLKEKLFTGTRQQIIERFSYIIIVISAMAVAIGIGLGSFIHGTVYIAVAGAALLLPGICIFIASQFMEEPEEKRIEGSGAEAGGS